MSRLTKYEPREYSMFPYQLKDDELSTKLDSIHKLGKLEDLEEQLGVPLDVVFKAIKTNVWNDKTKRQEWVVLDYSNGEFVLKTTKELYVDDNKSILALKDYGKAWWLKGDMENEEDN